MFGLTTCGRRVASRKTSDVYRLTGMKSIITAAILAITATTASAQLGLGQSIFTIATKEGNIKLQETPCSNGGKEAVMIYTTRAGGAYGCWFKRPTFVEIKWDIFVGADGSSLDAKGYTTIHNRY